MINTVIASCNSSTLDPYIPGSDNPWNKAKVKHCYRRLGYGQYIYRISFAGQQYSKSIMVRKALNALNAH